MGEVWCTSTLDTFHRQRTVCVTTWAGQKGVKGSLQRRYEKKWEMKLLGDDREKTEHKQRWEKGRGDTNGMYLDGAQSWSTTPMAIAVLTLMCSHLILPSLTWLWPAWVRLSVWCFVDRLYLLLFLSFACWYMVSLTSASHAIWTVSVASFLLPPFMLTFCLFFQPLNYASKWISSLLIVSPAAMMERCDWVIQESEKVKIIERMMRGILSWYPSCRR